MNRNQRRYKYKRPKSSEGKKKKNDIEEVLAPRSRRPMQSRCCYTAPDQHSFPQLTNSESQSQYQSPIGAEPRRSMVPENTTVKPVRPTQPEVITIARPKRPTLLDMSTVAMRKRPYQRPRLVKDHQAYRSSQSEVITIAKSNRTFASQPADQQTLTDAKKNQACNPSQHEVTIVKPYRSSRPDTDMATGPYISSPNVVTIDQCKSSLRNLTIAQLEELRMVLFAPCHKIEKSSQYVKPLGSESSFEWENVENTGAIEKIVLKGRDEETLTRYHSLPKNLQISETPRIKLMAVKFSKYKKDNLEVRRLEEKVVCVEYDVFDKEVDDTTPLQKMRAFFSIKPVSTDEKEAKELTELPPTIKSKFNISAADLQQLNQKEIEIIDGKIIENQPYLDDLRKILRRKKNVQNNKNTLNLQALYEMGKRDLLEFDTSLDTNTMPKDELVEMQNLILQHCKSSINGIRRTVKNNSKILEQIDKNTMSRSLVAELLRESNKNVTRF